MLPIKSSIFIECIVRFIKAPVVVFDRLELSLKTCFEGSAVILKATAAFRSTFAILREVFDYSLFRRISKQWLILIKEYTGKVLISIYEGSGVLRTLEHALSNSRLIR